MCGRTADLPSVLAGRFAAICSPVDRHRVALASPRDDQLTVHCVPQQSPPVALHRPLNDSPAPTPRPDARTDRPAVWAYSRFSPPPSPDNCLYTPGLDAVSVLPLPLAHRSPSPLSSQRFPTGLHSV